MLSHGSQSPTYTQLPVSYVSHAALLPSSFGEQSVLLVSQTQSGEIISQPPPQPFCVSVEEHPVQVAHPPGAYGVNPCYVPTRPPDKAVPRSGAVMPQTDTAAMGTVPEEQMKEKLYRIFGRVIEEDGPLEITDQKILNVFIKLTQAERKVIMSHGSIKAFLSKCSYINVTNNSVKVCGPVPSVSPTLSSSEESNISSGDASCLHPAPSTSSLNVCSAEFIPRSYCSQMDGLTQPSTNSIDSMRMSGLSLHAFPNFSFPSVEAEHIGRSNVSFAQGRMSSMLSDVSQHEAVVQTCVLCSDKAVQADITLEDKSLTSDKLNAALLRAIQAEEKVIHLQKNLCEQLLKHHRSLVQDGYLKIINDAKKSEQDKLPEYISVMKMIEAELLRIEAVHETNLSELRGGKELDSLPEISLKPSVLEKLISFSVQNPALKASGKDSKSNEDSLFEKINGIPSSLPVEERVTTRDGTAADKPLPIGQNEKPVIEKKDKENFPMFHYFPSSDISRTMAPLSLDQTQSWHAPSGVGFDYLSSCSVPHSGQRFPGAERMLTAEREVSTNKPGLVKRQQCDHSENRKQEPGTGDLLKRLPPSSSKTEQCNDQDSTSRSMLSQIYGFWQPGKTSQNGDQHLKNSDFSQDLSKFPVVWNQQKPDTDVPSPSRISTIPVGHLMSNFGSKQIPQSFPSAFPNPTSVEQLGPERKRDGIEILTDSFFPGASSSLGSGNHNQQMGLRSGNQDSGKQTSLSSLITKNAEADSTNPILSLGMRPDNSSSVAGISEISLNDEMEFNHQQTEDGEWKQVVKKHKKPSDANTSFEKMLQDIQSSVPKSTRQDVIKSVQEVKQRHGKLQGLNINQIKQEAVSILQERLDLPSQDATSRTKDYDNHQSEANIKVTEGSPAYKTAICAFWQQGTCKKTAKECTYAHGPDDLRTKTTVSPNQATKALFGDKEYDSHQLDANAKIAEGSLLYKTAICVFWQQGICKKTAKECAYAHGKEELRKQPKNIMCQNIAAKGECPYGDKCLFAHSKEEMLKASQKR